MTREVREGLQTQGPHEAITYRIRVTPAAVSAGNVSVRDQNTDTDVTATVTDADGVIVSDGALVLPLLHDLEASHFYEVEVAYQDASGATITPLFRVLCS